MKRLELTPDGWPCTLKECPPGHFLINNNVCFKSQYGDGKGNSEAFCHTGEAFWGGTNDIETKEKLEVQPLLAVWVEA